MVCFNMSLEFCSCFKVLLEWIQFLYDMVTLFIKNNIQKIQTQNTQWKQRYRWKQNRSMTWNIRHFLPASGRMTLYIICLWRHRKHGDSNKHWGQRRFEPSQETGVKKMINGNVSSEFISLWLRVCNPELQVLSNPASRLWFYAYKKYKNGNSVKRIALQRRIRPAICSGGSDNFSSGISWKLPKIATSNVIFSRTFDRIAAKFCMTI